MSTPQILHDPITYILTSVHTELSNQMVRSNDRDRLSALEADRAKNEEQQKQSLSRVSLELQHQRYVNDPVAFIENELKIFNPDREPSTIPFTLYDYQKKFVQDLYAAYRAQKDIIDEKSRQMGISWLYMAFFLWGLLHDPSFSGFSMSYKEDLVDDGGIESSPNSLFGKLRFMYERIEKKEYHGLLRIKSLLITNRQTGAYLVGESTNPNAGRGGTYKIGLWDETASTPKSETIYPAFQQAVKCQCLNSTVRGKGNVFARLRFDPNAGFQVHTLHWTAHPDKAAGLQWIEGVPTSPWYERMKSQLTPTELGQEVDINYETSVEGRVYDKLIKTVHLKPLEFNPEWKHNSIIAWDLGVSDETFAVVMQQDNQGNIGIVDEAVGTDEEIRFYISLVCGSEPKELPYLPIERRKMFLGFLQRSRQYGYAELINVGGPDTTQRSITSKASVRDQFLRAAEFGRDPTTGRVTDRRFRNMRFTPLTGYRVLDRIIAAKKLMDPQRNKFIVSERCVNVWERLVNYRWTQTPDGMNREQPEHDWASHGADAVGYGVLWFTHRKSIMQKPVLGESRARRTGPPGGRTMSTLRVGMR